MSRGRLKIFLGAAPGVGKTYAMLAEAHQLISQGVDVVIGVIETHGRRATQKLAVGIEHVDMRTIDYRDSSYAEMDCQRIIDRKPDVVLVDELAHSIPGSDRKRWHDVHTLLDAGIDVFSTVNIQHLESLIDVVKAITGQLQREVIPDRILREADDIELVDLSPEALRTRLAQGLIYSSDKVDAALSKYFRVGNLIALRELSLLWLADRVDEGLDLYRQQERIDHVWPTRERVLVAVTGGVESSTLIRRGARIAGRSAGRELLIVHVVEQTGLRQFTHENLESARRLADSLNASWHTVAGDDIAASLLDFARTVNATQLVIGTSRSSRWRQLIRPSVPTRILAGCGEIDVHMVRHDAKERIFHARPRSLSRQRRLGGWIASIVLPAILCTLFTSLNHTELHSLAFLSFLSSTVFVALIGGWWPAAFSAVIAAGVLNWFFTEPLYTFTISKGDNIVALIIFWIVAAAVAIVVDRAEATTLEAKRLRSQWLVLSDLAGTVITDGHDLTALLGRMAEIFEQNSICLVRTDTDDPLQAHVGDSIDQHSASSIIHLDEVTLLLMDGRMLTVDEMRILDVFGNRLLALLHERELQATKDEAKRLSTANAVRTALLTAVSHDLRTPLAALKAAVSSLRMTDVTLPEQIQQELIETIDLSADRLSHLINNLLDMSRIQSHAIDIQPVPVCLADVVGSAISSLDPGHCPSDLVVNIDGACPDVLADYGLLERIIANLIDNAAKYAPGKVIIDAAAVDDEVIVRVIDYGPGIESSRRQQIFLPFTRFDDSESRTGLGLGLAVAQGLCEAIGARLEADDTPGGGLTMSLSLKRGGDDEHHLDR